jgi:hypothetical protein
VKIIKIIYKKLGREKIWGQSTGLGIIEMDSRLKGKKHCEILHHEMIHELFPLETEASVTQKAIIMTNTIWGEMYRRFDKDSDVLLQDGSK